MCGAASSLRKEVIMSDPTGNFGFPVVDLPPAATCSHEDAVRFLVGQLVQSGRLQPMHAYRVICQVLHREWLASTGVGGGFAVPHSKSDVVSDVLGIVGRSTVAMTWPGAVDAQPVRVVCLLVTPASAPHASLRALQAVAREVSKLKGPHTAKD
jgi:mannitol/fructose-specific phosphotransferase system IIA component (Ntr-type)